MFKSVATKLAHNTTIPSLGGNKDLRPLQDLITAEKTVLISLQKLSSDFSKASEALRAWGLSEGDDLGDTLSASTILLNSFSSALSAYASQGHGIREHLKGLRSREEALDEVKRRRRTVFRNAEDADRKLSKMNSEHKHYQMQTDTLNKLRDEIRSMDFQIMNEEAALGDFKRTTTKLALGLKFGGLVACCEKGTIIGDFGRMITREIPEEQTQPGLNRSLYQGHRNTEALVGQAQHHLAQVVLTTVPTAGGDNRRFQPTNGNLPTPFNDSKPVPQPPRESGDFLPPTRPYSNDVPSSPASLNGPYQWPNNGDPMNSNAHLPEKHTMDDFGVPSRTSGGPMFSPDASSGRFATFPVKGRQSGFGDYGAGEAPSMSLNHEPEPSFADSIQDALEHKNPLPSAGSVAPLNIPHYKPLGGTITPRSSNPWEDEVPTGHGQNLTISDNDDALLAYMTSVDDDDHEDSPQAAQTAFQGPKGAAPPMIYDDHSRYNRHVQFGAVTDVDEEMEKRASVDRERRSHDREAYRISASGPPILPASPFIQEHKSFEEEMGFGHSQEATEIPTPIPEKPQSPPLSPAEQEKKLNAEAARQITIELEALNVNPPDPQRRPSMEAIAQRSQELEIPQFEGSYDNHSKESYSPLPSPLAPPSAPFSQRAVSPHPYTDLGLGGPPSYDQPRPQPSPLGSAYNTAPNSPPSSYTQQDQSQPRSPLNLPRLQGLPTYDSQEPNQLPARFQTSSGVSPLSTPFSDPPRFQPSPLSTPLSELRGPGLSSNKSSTSLQSSFNGAGPPGAAVGGRTISAAAFKRNRNMSGDVTTPGGSPGLGFKSLPSLSQGQPAYRSVSAPGAPIPRTASPVPAVPPINLEANRISHAGSDYDYIDAYMDNSGPPSPNKAEPGAPSGGYGSGLYSTHLVDSDSGLR